MLFNKKYLTVALIILAFFFASFKALNTIMQPYKSYEYIMQTLSANYIEALDIEDLHNNALKELLQSLDPYSKFYDKTETEDRKNTWAGILGYSIGVNILYRNDYTYVSAVNPGSPAEAADVRPGDKIAAIDNQTIYRAFNKDVEAKLKGEENTTIELLIERQNSPNGETESLKKTISRAAVPNIAIPYAKLLTNGNAYIKLQHFYGNAASDLKQLINSWQNSKQNFENLILDLRNNRGGGVKQATDVAGLFLPEQSVVFYHKKRNADFEAVKTEQAPIAPSLPLIVLIDENTMSAAELVAGALQDYDRAIIVGANSFGKGLVQQTWNNGDSTSMYFTISKYFTPLKRCIQKLDYENYYLKDKKERLKKQVYGPKKKQWFTTRNGRKFFDYSGIVPDVELSKPKQNEYIKNVISSFALYDFANNYRNKNAKPPVLENFEIDETTYNEFLTFLEQPENYIALPINKEVASIENFINETVADEGLIEQLEQFKQKLNASKAIIHTKNEKQLKAILSENILHRYFNLKGQYHYQFKNDDWVSASFDLLNNKKEYQKKLGY